jgi:hypothetical protein
VRLPAQTPGRLAMTPVAASRDYRWAGLSGKSRSATST